MFNHYIAVDWAQKNMAIARMTGGLTKVSTWEGPSSVKELKVYLKELKGKKALTIEESTASQWLYTELKDHVDELIICDPYRNKLLSDGPKTDKIDAIKLVKLLKANLLKPVYHSGEEFILLRKLVSGYIDLVRSGVRFKNQRSALFFAKGMAVDEGKLEHSSERFVLKGLEESIESYEKQKALYEDEFKKLSKKFKTIRLLKSLPGIRDINAVKIAALVVDPKRFPTKGHFLSYCGLIKLDRISGGKSYGQKNPRYCRTLKEVFKMAAYSVIGEKKTNPMQDYYKYLMTEKNLSPRDARSAVARRIAILAYGILKTGKKFDPHLRGKLKTEKTLTDLQD